MIDAPEGTLRLGRSQGCVQYFHCSEDTRPSGKYIPKGNMELARKLAQKAYDEKIIKLTTKRLRQLDSIINDYCDDEIAQTFFSEHQERQKLITPVEELYEQKLERWMANPYSGKGFGTEDPVITTDKGMLDNPEYARTAAKKIELYEKNGIFPGDNLILTFETSTQILDKKILELLVQRYLE